MPIPSDPEKKAYMFSDDMKFLQKAVVIHPQDPTKFLILKRAQYHKYRPNDWDFPGGNVMYGEDAIDSLTREIFEETGLHVTDLKPVNVRTNPRFEGNIYLLVINYICTAKGEKITLSNEHTSHQWVTKHEFEELKPTDFMSNLTTQIFAEI